MQARAIAMARWLLPVPVPPTNTALRCSVRKEPPARSRTNASLTGVPAKSNSSMSLASGSLAYAQLVLDRARLLLGDLGAEQVAEDARRLVPALDAGGHHLVVRRAHAVELECRHQLEDVAAFHQEALRRRS